VAAGRKSLKWEDVIAACCRYILNLAFHQSSSLMPFLYRPLCRLTVVIAVAMMVASSAFAQAPDTRVITTWQEPVKLGSAATTIHHYEVAYDYAANQTIQTIRDASGAVIETQILDRAPQPNEDEVAEAIALVYADAELGQIASRQGNVVEGGFLLYEGDCERARCVQLHIGSIDGSRTDRFVVVDLSTTEIVHRNLYPDLVD
jgi:hypothetical protein